MVDADRFAMVGGDGVEYFLSRRPESPVYYRTWYDPREQRQRRATLGTSQLEEAKRKLATWCMGNARARDRSHEEVTIEELTAAYWEDHAKHLTSRRAARGNLDRWEAFWTGQALADVTPVALARFRRQLEAEQLSVGYIRRIFGTGRAAFNHAVKNRYVDRAPFVELPAEEDTGVQILTHRQVHNLFAAMKSDHGFRYLLLAFSTLAREEAILDLQGQQIDLERRLINLNPPGRKQTKKRRPTVPIPGILLPFVEDLGPEEYAVSYRGKKKASVYALVSDAARRAGIGAIGSRVIRHHMATQLRAAGVPVWELEGILGHRVPSTSERYAAFAPDYLSHATRVIDQYLTEHVGDLVEARKL